MSIRVTPYLRQRRAIIETLDALEIFGRSIKHFVDPKDIAYTNECARAQIKRAGFDTASDFLIACFDNEDIMRDRNPLTSAVANLALIGA
jgi:hypothetical protein